MHEIARIDRIDMDSGDGWRRMDRMQSLIDRFRFKKRQLCQNQPWLLYQRFHVNNLVTNSTVRPLPYLHPGEINGIGVRDLDISESDYAKFISLKSLSMYRGRKGGYSKVLEYIASIRLTGIGGQTVLIDAAGGYGEFARAVNEAISPRRIYCQDGVVAGGSDGNIELVGGDISDIPLPAGSVDVVTCHHSFEHFRGDQDREFVREALRILKPGGILCIVPLFLATEYAEIWNTRKKDLYDPEARQIYDPLGTFPGWGPYERYARVYDLDQFTRRILPCTRGSATAEIVNIRYGGKPAPDLRTNSHQPAVNGFMKALLVQKNDGPRHAFAEEEVCAKQRLLFRYKPLDTGLEKKITENPGLRAALEVVDMSEPWGETPDPEAWARRAIPPAVGLVWGMFKLDSPMFVDFCRERGIPLIYVERSPLLKNGKLALYFDKGGTTNFSEYWNAANWARWVAAGLDADQREMVERYRDQVAGRSTGIDVQKTGFMDASEIKQTLGIPMENRILFCPLQVDHDVTITQAASSPWIRNMEQFGRVVMSLIRQVPRNYTVVVKEHPRNVADGIDRKSLFVGERVRYVRDEVNANALTQNCDVILTINSGVGTEAMVFHKPVISLGRSFYSDKGLNWYAGSESELAGLLADLESMSVDKTLMDIYIYHFVYDYTYDLDSVAETDRFIKTFFRADCLQEERRW